MTMICDEAYAAADEIIEALLQDGKDYSKHRDQIALEGFENGLLQGNWDTSVHLQDDNLQDLRIINEDEYDQHMDEDEDRPEHSEIAVNTSLGYVWLI